MANEAKFAITVAIMFHSGPQPTLTGLSPELPRTPPPRRIRGFRPLNKESEIGNSRFRLCGGWGWGSWIGARLPTTSRPPTPNPPPQGGGEEFAAPPRSRLTPIPQPSPTRGEGEREFYSTDRLAAFTTLAHFAVSSARNLPNSAGDMVIGMPPRSASFAFIFGLASAAAIDLFRISTTSAGVPLGAEMPYQGAASKPGIVSAMAGMSGSPGQRCATVTPSARNWPLRTNSIEPGRLSNSTWTLPVIRSG